MSTNDYLNGVKAVNNALSQIEKSFSVGELSVGFQDGATYPDGTLVSAVAFWNEFGAVVEVAEHETTIYRSVKSNGSFNKRGRFVPKSKSNFATSHNVKAHTIHIPARPFFRNMIGKNAADWPSRLAKALKYSNMNVNKAFNLLGEEIKDDLVNSIRDTTEPPNAKSTIAKKGFDKPLVGVDHRLTESITYKVE